MKIIQATHTQQLNCWGYCFELTIQITEKDLNRIPETVEGKPPICYGLRPEGTHQKNVPPKHFTRTNGDDRKPKSERVG